MIIHALKFRQSEGDKLHILDSSLQALYCSDAHLLRSLSQTLLRTLSAEKVLAQPLPLTAIADMPGRGALSALLVAAPGALQDSVPSVSLGNTTPEIIGADLILISVEEMLEAGNDYERIALELAAITDTGNCHHGLIAALANLDGLTESIGRGNAAESALGRAKSQMEQLKTERAALKAALEQASTLAPALHEKREYIMQCRERRGDIEAALCTAVVAQVTPSSGAGERFRKAIC